jgi:CRISPR/Cas system-associated endonuclease Cas3-HD
METLIHNQCKNRSGAGVNILPRWSETKQILNENDIYRLYMAKLRDRKVIKESAGLRHMNERIDDNSKEEKELGDQLDNIINMAQKSKVSMSIDQYNRFKDLCKHNCTNRKLRLAGMALGPVVAIEILDLIMAGADIAQLVLRKNCLGDKGVQIISKCLISSNNGIEIY